MGSDLYMEQRNWSPRKTLVEWLDDETIKVQRDAFYTGYFTVYEGRVTPEVTTLLKGLGISLPDKDPYVLYMDNRHKVKVEGPESLMTQEVITDLEIQVARGLERLGKALSKKYPRFTISVN